MSFCFWCRADPVHLQVQVQVSADKRFLSASCVGVSISAVSVGDQLSFLAGVRRLLNNGSFNICREIDTNKLFSCKALYVC